MLKLVALCKDIAVTSRREDNRLLCTANIERLLCEKLLYVSKAGDYYRVTRAGYDLLQRAGYAFQPDDEREGHKHVLERRDRVSQVMLSLMLAGVDVFASDVQELRDDNRFLPIVCVRRIQRTNGMNTTSNTRFVGLMSRFVFYYVSDSQGTLYGTNEARTARNMLARRNGPAGETPTGDGRPAVVYMGADYPTLCAAVTAPQVAKHTYRSSYDNFTTPVHLCPCDPDGAYQMRIMLQPDYRNRIISAVLGNGAIANPFYPGCDGTLDKGPFVLGIDMDLRRITGMIQAARMGGVKSHIFLRRCQGEALKALFPEKDIAFYVIEDNELQSIFSFSTLLAEPPIEPYITKEGEYIHDETIRTCREARKAYRKKGKASQKED